MGKAAEYMSRTKIGARFHETRESRKLVLVIVAIALLLDNMLLTTVGKRFYRNVLHRYNLNISEKQKHFNHSTLYKVY